MPEPAADAQLEPLLASYAVPVRTLRRAPRRRRESAAVVATACGALGPGAGHLSSAHARIARQIHDNGVTSHARLSIWCPRNGWVDLDPTNAVLPDTRHVTIAWGRDYGDVSPLRGVVLGGGPHELHVGVSVVPVS